MFPKNFLTMIQQGPHTPRVAPHQVLLRVEVCGVCRTDVHMSDISAFPYELLWDERSLCSVANLTRQHRQRPLVAVRKQCDSLKA